ncbi:MAG: hypothetical protein ACM3X1_04055 [Ignavibacteriales bacterium]
MSLGLDLNQRSLPYQGKTLPDLSNSIYSEFILLHLANRQWMIVVTDRQWIIMVTTSSLE